MELLPIEETPSALEDYSIMCSLPNEVLEHIFAFLHVQDRKSVRLVCRLWYHCSTSSSSIMKKEKLVFRTYASIEDITKVMLQSNFTILNLEFEDLPVNSLPIGIWKECGYRIHSLKFYECQWDDETIENIIIHCVNLISFTFETREYWSSSGKDDICSPLVLDKIVDKGIRRPKLHTFTVFIDDPSIDKIMSKIFYVYPCIRHFATNRKISSFLISHLPISLESLTFTPSHFFFPFPLTEQESTDVMEAYVAKAKQGLRLKHFNGIFANTENFLTEESLLWNFFLVQKDLNAIELKIEDIKQSAGINNKLLFFHILKSCPSLQKIRFDCYFSYIIFKLRECPQFLSSISKLQSLHLCLRISSDGPRKSSKSLLPSILTPSKNLVLTTLELEFCAIEYVKEEDHFCAALLQHCPLLLHLKLRNSSDNVLSIILKYLLKLQTLILSYKSYNLCHNDYTGESYSIKQLQQLKHLGISSCDEHRIKPLTRRIMLEIQLSRLEFLKLNAYFLLTLEEELINCLSSQLLKLRFLSLVGADELFKRTDIQYYYNKILQFFMNLKDLYGVKTDARVDPRIASSIIEDIFRVCPSLKYVSDGVHVFLCDPITNKICVQYNDGYNSELTSKNIVNDIFSKKLID